MPRTTHRPATVVALLLALFMAAMEMTVVSTAMPTVVAELGGALHYAWVFTAYMLTSTVTVPIYGKLADLHGRKPVLLAAIGLFLLGSLACGHAKSMTALILFRGVQGLGAGGMQPIAMTVIGDIFDIEERGKMQALFGAVWAIAGLLGPLVGGVIVATLTWPWVFYINVPFGILSAAMLWVALIENVDGRGRSLDIAGALLLSAAAVCLLLGSDGVMPWVLIPLFGGLTYTFGLVERRVAEPMVSLALLSRPVLATSSALSAMSGGAMLGLTTFVPLYAQNVIGAKPTEAGSTIATMAVAWPIASAVSGRLMVKVGFRSLVRVGFVVAGAASLGLAGDIGRGGSIGSLRVLSALFGLGMGIGYTPLVVAVQTSVAFSERGVATASTLFFRNIGGTIAVGIMGAVLAQVLQSGGGLASGIARVAWIIAGLGLASGVVSLLFPKAGTGTGTGTTR